MQLAQVNIAHMRAPLDDPVMAEFVANLGRINAMAEGAPGFVWRLVGDGGDATDVPYGDRSDVIVNISVWESVDALRDFTYRSPHLEFVRRRREWFAKLDVFLAMWWVEDGHRPGVAEAKARLTYLERHGPGARAFTFGRTFEPDGSPTPQRDWGPDAGQRNAHLPEMEDQPTDVRTARWATDARSRGGDDAGPPSSGPSEPAR